MDKEKETKVKQQILEGYFTFRSNLPQKGFVQQNRSTCEIRDDLYDMMCFTNDEICEYMIDHDFAPTTEQDGTVKWAIWRRTEV